MFSMFPGISDGSHGSGRFGERRGFRFDGGSGGGGRLPAGGQQDAEVVPVGHGRQPFEDVGEIGFRIVAVTAGAFHQGVNDGGALAGGFSAHEEPVLFPDGRWPDAVFDPVVIDQQFAVAEIEGQPVPEPEGIVDGLAKRALCCGPN